MKLNVSYVHPKLLSISLIQTLGQEMIMQLRYCTIIISVLQCNTTRCTCPRFIHLLCSHNTQLTCHIRETFFKRYVFLSKRLQLEMLTYLSEQLYYKICLLNHLIVHYRKMEQHSLGYSIECSWGQRKGEQNLQGYSFKSSWRERKVEQHSLGYSNECLVKGRGNGFTWILN